MNLTNAKLISNLLLAVFTTCIQSAYFLHLFLCKSAIWITCPNRTNYTFLYSILSIFLGRTHPQMLWIHTKRHITRMADKHPLWYLLFVVHLVRVSVRPFLVSLFNPKISVAASRFSTFPNPATVFSLFNKPKESRLGGNSFTFIPRWLSLPKCHAYIVPCTSTFAI